MRAQEEPLTETRKRSVRARPESGTLRGVSPLETALVALCSASLVAWLHLVFAHGRFWMADQRLGGPDPEPPDWPTVSAVVPARNEADVVEHAVGSILAQDYPGLLRVVLVDDESEDGTDAAARAAAQASGRADRFHLLHSTRASASQRSGCRRPPTSGSATPTSLTNRARFAGW
jgi:hypothetical protein